MNIRNYFGEVMLKKALELDSVKGITNYGQIPLYKVKGVETTDDVKINNKILPDGYYWVFNNEDNKVRCYNKKEALHFLKEDNVNFSFSGTFDDYYRFNNNYKRENAFDMSTIKVARLFDVQPFTFRIEIPELDDAIIYDFYLDGKRKIFLTDEELFSISNIENFKPGYCFISLPNYSYEGKRIWFIITTRIPRWEDEFVKNKALICRPSSKYFNRFNNNSMNIELGNYTYKAKIKRTIEEHHELAVDLDLRPSEILKIVPALFTIADYNDKKIYDEKQKLIKEEKNNEAEVCQGILKDYYENCLSRKVIKEKYNVTMNKITNITIFGNSKYAKLVDVSLVNRKRKLSSYEKKLVNVYNQISDDDKKSILTYIDTIFNSKENNIFYHGHNHFDSYPENIKTKYDVYLYNAEMRIIYYMIYLKSGKEFSYKSWATEHAKIILQMI